MTRYKALYFLFFASVGALGPYINLYFKRLGLDGAEIGILATMRPLATFIGPPLAVAFAARTGSGRFTLPVIMFAGLVPFALLLGIHDFWALLPTFLLVTLFKSPAIPMLDDATLRHIEGTTYDYGRIRLWGSLGFILGANAVGLAAESLGLKVMLVGHFTASAAAAFVALWLARGRGLPDVAIDGRSERFWRHAVGTLRLVWEVKQTRWAFAAGFLARSAELTFLTFFAIYADELGMSASLIGLAWAIAVLSEVGVMGVSGALLKRIGPRRLFLSGILAGAVRWVICAKTSSVWVLLGSQVLHGLTFGAFHVGAVTLIHTLLPAARRTEGQSVWAVVTAGIPGLLGTYLVGYLYDLVGVRPLFTVSATLAALGVLAGLRIHAPRTARRERPTDYPV